VRSARRGALYAQTPGNRGAWLLRRDQGDRTEFIALLLWDSVDAIRAFAGDDIEAAVLYPEDARYLVGGESTVTHYHVVDQVQAIAAPTSCPKRSDASTPRRQASVRHKTERLLLLPSLGSPHQRGRAPVDHPAIRRGPSGADATDDY
jgi:heme-degrading monooxygenase HmoA